MLNRALNSDGELIAVTYCGSIPRQGRGEQRVEGGEA
jgi:hypothetical protein